MMYEFTTATCTYCRITHPQVTEYAFDNDIQKRVVNADPDTNTDEEKALCAKYEIQSVPVVVIEDETTPTILRGFTAIMRYMKG